LAHREENRRIVFFDGLVFLNAEDARIARLLNRLRLDMAFRNEPLSKANPAISINATAIQEPIFFDIIPANFVRAFDASCRDRSTIMSCWSLVNLEPSLTSDKRLRTIAETTKLEKRSIVSHWVVNGSH
jgi:hypothetical protein